ncbi:MAG TPA: YidC/Oxa1 family membrane protein insertase [Patescibacteria group bacterium]|jgi:YidC/Oxa1 family membrane protein insertase|nr:YidC/Oxa1 family membrane protein insertase [Patescibacteria group bacterium]
MGVSEIFKTILLYPLLNLLVFFYNYIPDIGVVIILLTVLVRLALLPSFHKSLKHQKALQDLQPKMNEVKEKYKDDKEQQAKALMELYKVHKVNPLSSCLPLLIQLPILIALYQVFIQSLNGQALHGIYSFVHVPSHIDPMFLHLINLKEKNLWMPAIAAILQYFQGKLTQPKIQAADTTSKMMNYQMLYMFPILTFFIGLQFPAGLTLYWIITTLFGIGQQYYILHKEANKILHAGQ